MLCDLGVVSKIDINLFPDLQWWDSKDLVMKNKNKKLYCGIFITKQNI